MKNIFTKEINLTRDWKIIATFFALGLAIISIFAWRVYLSNHIGGGYFKIDITSIDVKSQIIDKDRIQKSISALEERQKNLIDQAL